MKLASRALLSTIVLGLLVPGRFAFPQPQATSGDDQQATSESQTTSESQATSADLTSNHFISA